MHRIKSPFRVLVKWQTVRLAPRNRFDTHRCYHDFVRGQSPTGQTYKVELNSRKIVGRVTSRGSRRRQEDRTGVASLVLSPQELQLSLKEDNVEWDPRLEDESGAQTAHHDSSSTDKKKEDLKAQLAGQVAYFAIFDGHGGQQVSEHLHKRLHSTIEDVNISDIDDTVAFTKEIGGYFKRFRGGLLKEWVGHPDLRKSMSIAERLTLAFLKTDQHLLSQGDAQHCGSTASVALIHSLDEPVQPFFMAQKVSLTVAHLGDTKILLCNKKTGKVEPLTEQHHAETPLEASRLRRMGGGGLVLDSFGESRWMGAVENTRSFGDGEFKPMGVTAEPDIKHRIVNGSDYAYMVFVTDGVNSLISNQEIIDLARNAFDPERAATAIVNFAEDLGAQDNCTCLVIPLAGWGEVGGQDETEARREYRRSKAISLNTRMQRM